ncbi:peptide N-acetyl-beta-D-glucosaminyl asparaginase amidase A-domain-containing protein [Phanerochaete sordida]|uniref:Peptide N-acetyl-beta-D-glucosaminyl asparaginase amidase A-domain-containing protein n=1 Tax=Phanerochaete sordida TaxID=48140 RepID=A0A9P3GA80_9APHY|nr:peptide N-acetyl-beta-D-glucosaminyl asparaginase amidase A-domain-containing protein [Phanerochaete sordida]
MLRLPALTLLAAAVCAAAQPLVDFQVAQPPPLPQDAKQCTVQILQRTFGFSFGDPEIVQFTPPTDCGPVGSWAGISLNFTVTSNGTQFDRLGIFTFQNVEIWRTSTPEPTTGAGIIWTYLKDVTRFLPLFAKPGTFILQLDNLLETGLDGQYASTLHATFFASSAQHPPAPRADLIVPVTTLANDTGNDASVPPIFSLNVTLPRNTVEVYAELLASGNGDEEFWYFNTANQFVGDLPAGTSFGNGPFREVRLLIDGTVAGTAFPYAVIFTGGIAPTAWRPITSYRALDLPNYFLDVTPFVPLLTDGQPHNFSLDVVSAESDHAINQNWFVSGLLQVVTDPSGKPTTGKMNVYQGAPFAQTSTTGSVGANGDVNVTVKATRNIRIESTIVSGSGKVNNVVFTQALSYSNTQSFLNDTFIQNVQQTATGAVSSLHNGVPSTIDTYSFPLTIDLTFLPPTGNSFFADFDHSYTRTVLPSPFILGSTIQEHQLAHAFFEETAQGNFGNGTSNNTLNYVDLQGHTYDREVNAVNTAIVFDHQGGNLAPVANRKSGVPASPTKLNLVKPRLPGRRTVGGGQ